MQCCRQLGERGGLLAGLLIDNSHAEWLSNARWKMILPLLYASVPQEKLEAVGKLQQDVVSLDKIGLVLGRVATVSLALAVGWVVHQLSL